MMAARAREPAAATRRASDKVATHLWFDDRAEEAATLYTALFPDSRVDRVVRAPPSSPDGTPGAALQVVFTLVGRTFLALNGGPGFEFTPAISLFVDCDTQDEVDRYWDALSADPGAERCGWLKDRFGLSWQIVPKVLPVLLGDPDRAKAERVRAAMMEMGRIDVAALLAAANAGQSVTSR